MVDWGDGEYERTAATLVPSAERLVHSSSVAAGEAVLDLGCGTGNVALQAAALGARVTAVDPASRLLEVTARRARERGLEVHVVPGRAEAIPAGDGSFDLVLSHFALIFCDDEQLSLRELRRVLRPGGRLVFTSWLADGAVHAALDEFRRAVAAARGPSPARFSWWDPEALRSLVGREFSQLEVTPETATFEAPSPEAFIDAFVETHPVGRFLSQLLDEAGSLAETRQRAVAAASTGSETPDGFEVTSPYVVVRAGD